MKIVQTPVRFYPYIGGVENYVYNLSKQLVKMGHEVKVICADETGKFDGRKRDLIDGVEVERLSYIGKIANTNITPTLPLKLLRENFDVIHTHLPTPWSADWSALISIAKRKPLVLTYHNDIVGRGFANYVAKFYNMTALKLLLKTAKKIIVTQEKYLENSPFLKKYRNKIEVIPVGVDTEKFRPLNLEREENTLFFLSILDEFHRYKGLDVLLKALVRVKNKIPNVKLWVGGSGKLMTYYKNLARNLGIESNVEFLGYVPDDKLVELYNRCSAFVLPSTDPKQEGFGIVLLEAMACGTPVITTDIVGVAEDVKEVGAGEVVRPGDVDGLAEAIVKILSRDYYHSHSIRFVEEKYGWKTVSKRIFETYRETR